MGYSGDKRYARRKWGWYLVLLDRKHFKIKLLRFKRNAQCSLQKHYARHELWCILKGGGYMMHPAFPHEGSQYEAKAVSGDSIHVDMRSWHQFRATTATWVLEIQYGDACQEEDITRV